MADIEKLADKQFYDELTDKQQTVVDALAENPDKSYNDIERETGVHNTYIGVVAKKYDHIIEERKQVKANEHMESHNNGNVTVEGELDLTDGSGEQSISERPVKSISDGGETDEEGHLLDYVDSETAERLEHIGEEITPDWMDQSANAHETVRYLARFYHGEVEE